MGTQNPKHLKNVKGKKRKSTAPISTPLTPTRKSRKQVELLTLEKYRPSTIGTRILSCGEGEQIGHPGRNVTRKPRAIDTFPEGTEFVQVAAGGVHSLVLTTDGTVYSCGINEKGTVPVDGLPPEETIDKFTRISFSSEIKKLGKIVQITAGASFSAALTEEGSVIAWGNLRDTQGEMSIHETLNEIKKAPVIVFNHKKAGNKKIVKIAAGENHLAMLSERGEILTLGEGSMGQLGRSVRMNHIRSRYMVDDTGSSLVVHILEKGKFVFFVDVWAKGFWTIARADDGRIFACGLNNFGQLGTFKKVPHTRKSTTRLLNTPLINFDDDIMEDSNKLNGHASQNGIKSSQEDGFSGEGTATEESTNERTDDERESEKFGKENADKIGLITCANSFPAGKTWTHFAGVHHIICRNDDGELFGIGKNTDNALGLGTWTNNEDQEHWRYDTLQQIHLPDGEKVAGLDATLGASIVWTESGKVYAFGCDTVGQLGLGIKDDEEKVVPTPKLVHSAHLEDYYVLSSSIADNHTLFLASKSPAEKKPRESLNNLY